MTRGLSGSRRARQSFCCCSSVSSVPLRAQPVFDVVPELHVAQRGLHQFLLSTAGNHRARHVQSDAEQHVIVDRDWQRVGTLKHHPDTLAQLRQGDILVVDVAAKDADLAGRPHVFVSLVDAIETTQQGRLAATGRSDQRGDHPRFDVDHDVLERLEVPVPEIQIAGLDRVRLDTTGRGTAG